MRQPSEWLLCALLLAASASEVRAEEIPRLHLPSAEGTSESAGTRERIAQVSLILDGLASAQGGRVCATALWPAMSDLNRFLTPSSRSALTADLGSLLVRPALDTFYDVPQAPFRIHYSLIGTHAVRDGTTDTLADGRPRYVHAAADALVHARELLLDSLGFLPPLSDSGLGGGLNLVDCYLYNFLGYAGFTAGGEMLYGRFVGSDTIVASAAYIAVHPTMSGLSTTVDPYDYLRITCAHEFFHTIHFAYDYEEKPMTWQQFGFWLEGTAVWFEDYAYPDVNDWAYLPYYLDTPERSLTYSPLGSGLVRPYGAGSMWAFYLVERFGTPSILRDIWNRCGLVSGDNTLAATDSVLVARGSSLNGSWHEFADWCMHTGTRWEPGRFAQGADWPQVEPTMVLFNYPAAVHFTDGSDPLAGDVGAGVPISTIGPSGSAVGALGFTALAHLPFPSQRADSSERLYVQSLPALPVRFEYVARDTSGSSPAVEESSLPSGDTTLVPSWLRFDTLFVLASSGLHYDAGDSFDDPPASVTALLSVALDSAGAGIAGVRFSDPYPNPLVRSRDAGVIFIVELPQVGDVHLDVFSVAGDRIRSFLLENVSVWPPASLTWDGRNEQGTEVASGLYLCKLTVELAQGEREEKLFRVGVVR